MNLGEIKAVLANHGFSPLKQLGQNFLHDQNLTAWLAREAIKNILPEAAVVEIGPGLGALTEHLIPASGKLIALEKDRGLSAYLRHKYSEDIASGRFDLREGDALDLLPALQEKPAVICGNLPYYISTPLLMESLKKPAPENRPPRLFFLMQREVGMRLASRPEGKEYGALSVLIQVSYKVEIVRTLPGSVFFPAPEVASVAVQLTPLPEPLVQPHERISFTKVVQRGFSQRRKKLSNLLPTEDGRRAEHLTPKEWVELWHTVRQIETA